MKSSTLLRTIVASFAVALVSSAAVVGTGKTPSHGAPADNPAPGSVSADKSRTSTATKAADKSQVDKNSPPAVKGSTGNKPPGQTSTSTTTSVKTKSSAATIKPPAQSSAKMVPPKVEKTP